MPGWRDKATPVAPGWQRNALPPEDQTTEEWADAGDGGRAAQRLHDRGPSRVTELEPVDVDGRVPPAPMRPRAAPSTEYSFMERLDSTPLMQSLWNAVSDTGERTGTDRDVGRSLASGVVQGSTLGYGDELAGAMGAATGEGYTVARDRVRGEQRANQQAHPFAAGIGEIAGGMLIPVPGLRAGGSALGRAAQATGIGAGVGAAAGLGASEADTLEGLARDTAVGAGVGSAAGGLLTGGTDALARGATRLARGAQSHSNLQRVAAAGPTLGEVRRINQNFPGRVDEMANVMRREGIGGAFASTADHIAPLEAARARGGEQIGEVIAEAQRVHAATPRPPSPGPEMGTGLRLRNEVAAPRLRSAATPLHEPGQQIESFARNIEAQSGPHASPLELMRHKRDAAQLSGFDQATPSRVSDAWRDAYGVLRSDLESSVENAGRAIADPTLSRRYAEARQTFGMAETLQDSAADRVLRNNTNRVVSPTDYATGLSAAMATGNPALAIGAGVVNRYIRTGREHSLASAGAQGVASMARRAATMLGDGSMQNAIGAESANALRSALRQGSQAFAARLFVTMQESPRLREAMDASTEQQGDTANAWNTR